MSKMEELLTIEWEMFRSVNGDDRDDSQNDFSSFCKMREAQYSLWSEKTLDSYYKDLKDAQDKGINLLRQKYIRMMKTTDPEGYEHFKSELPDSDGSKRAYVEDLWNILLEQTLEMRKKYPVIALNGRPLYASEETDSPSIETYQKSEFYTYSDETLKSLLEDVRELKAQGIDYAYKVQENSVLCLGYPSMEEAEKAAAMQILRQFGAAPGGGCCCGSDYEGC